MAAIGLLWTGVGMIVGCALVVCFLLGIDNYSI
jgi:hypothetical protein